MTIKRIAISIAVLLMGGLFAATAEADPIDERFAGSTAPTAIDTDGDGFNVAVVFFQAKGPPPEKRRRASPNRVCSLSRCDGDADNPGSELS